jgi:hypothetical protein
MVEITKDVLILFMQFNNDIKSAFGQWTLADMSFVANVSKEPTGSIPHLEDGDSSFIRNFGNTASIYRVCHHTKPWLNIML